MSEKRPQTPDDKVNTASHLEDPESLMKEPLEDVDYSGAVAKSDPAEIALVRKLDMRIMPTLWAMYFMNYLDRNAIANARLNDLEKDLGLEGTQYNTCISILFVGQVSLNANPLKHVDVVKENPALDIHGDPGALYLLSAFYTRKEVATRIAILYSGNIFATSFAGLIAAATFASIDGAHGFKGWQWLFIIEGVVTFAVAIAAAYLLPDFPLTTKWLTEEERILADARIKRDTVGLTPDKGAREGFKQAIRDPRLYLLCFMQNMHLSACSFNNFFPTVVGSLGYDRTITLALTCPPYLVSGFFGYAIGITSGKYNERTWHITGCMGAALVGFVISCLTLNTPARYISCFLFASGAYAVNSVILGWVSATLGQTTEKKAVSLSIVNVVANASYIYTAYLYPKSDGPKYLTAMGSNAGFAFATIASAWAFRFWLMRTNTKIRRSGDESKVFYAY
ncbi:hypothetical protein VE04_03394 [Pseudogymnoascus sp. 24MN13]|nr:hypothetical protein VE04_03394 [Pseudogymnoascus sp. 24MN13]